MATTARKPKRLSDEDLARVLELAKQSDSVELKLTVPATDQRKAVAALELDPLEAQIRQVFFFDTPELALNAAGVVVRARRIQGKGGDYGRQAAPGRSRRAAGEPAQVAQPRRRGRRDARRLRVLGHAEGQDRRPRREESRCGRLPIRKLFSKEQRAFFADNAVAGAELDELAVLGPIFVLKLNFRPAELGRRIVAELWLYPDGSRILELSTKCTAADAFQVAAESRAFLREGRRPLRRAADEDEDRARVLLAGARGEGLELRVAVDLGQLVVGEVEAVERGDVVLELGDARGADERRGHTRVAKRPRERQLSQRLPAPLGDLVQGADPLEHILREPVRARASSAGWRASPREPRPGTCS